MTPQQNTNYSGSIPSSSSVHASTGLGKLRRIPKSQIKTIDQPDPPHFQGPSITVLILVTSALLLSGILLFALR